MARDPLRDAAGPGTPARHLRRRFLLLVGLRWLPEGLLGPVYVLLALSGGAEVATVGLCVAAYSALVVALEVPSGALADAVGRRPVLLAGTALQAAHAAGLLLADGLPALLVVFAVGGAGRALLSGPLEAWWVDATRALDADADLRPGLARAGAVEGVALAAGALVVAGLPLVGDLRPAPAGGADGPSGLGLVAALATVAAGGHLVAVALLVPGEAPGPAGPAVPAGGTERPPGALRTATAAAVLAARDRAVRALLLTALTLGAGHFALEVFWQPRLDEVLPAGPRDTTPFGLLAAAAFLVSAAASAAVPRLLRGDGAGRGAVLGQLATGAAVLGLGSATGAAATVVALLAAFAALGVAYPLRAELLHERASAGNRATLLSLDSLALQAGGIVASVGVGALVTAGGIPAVWVLTGAACAVGSLLLVPSARGRAGATEAGPTGP